MKYCLTYQKNKTIEMKKPDELKIIFNENDKTLPQFLEEHSNQTILIQIKEMKEDTLSFFNALNKKYNNFKLVFLPSAIEENFNDNINYLQNNNIKFFFSYAVNGWDSFNHILSYKPSDVYIEDALGFDIKQVSLIAHKNNCAVRIFPNKIPNYYFSLDSLTRFFVRPEDIHSYEKYVDVCEFICPIDRELTLYRVYAEGKQWWGPLKEIIIGLDSNIDNRYIGPEFSLFRLSCQKKCARGDSCNMCHLIEQLSHTIAERKDKGLIK